MKARKPSGQIWIIFETDLSQAKSLDEEKLTPLQKAVYDKLSEKAVIHSRALQILFLQQKTKANAFVFPWSEWEDLNLRPLGPEP